MSLSWLTICADGQSTDCIPQVQLFYLLGVVVAVILLVVVAVRSRDFSTATIALIPVAIAINVTIGALITALRLPIYLDSIGTVLVGALAGPWAGAITGILANLIWSILPVPGGAGPTIAFFAPVAGVIGLMAGFWSARGVLSGRLGSGSSSHWLGVARRGRCSSSEHDRAAEPGATDPTRRPTTRTASSCSGSGSSPSACSSPGCRTGRSSDSRPKTRGSGATSAGRRGSPPSPSCSRSSASSSARAATSRPSPASMPTAPPTRSSSAGTCPAWR